MPIAPSFISFRHDLSLEFPTSSSQLKGDVMNNDLASLFGGQAFDPNSVEPAKDFDVLPPGKYLCLIKSAEVKQTKAGTGYGLQLELLVVDGSSKNRKLFPWINLQNPNTVCEEIGRREFAALCLAVGFSAIDTTQLIGKVIVAHVKVKNDQNDVRTYSAATQAPVAPQSSTPVPVNTLTIDSSGSYAAPAPVQPVPVQSSSAPVAPAPMQTAPQQQVPVQSTQGSRPWDRPQG